MSERDRSQTRGRIIEAATDLFWRNGYHGVSTDAICRAAQVSKSSLYHAFSSKEDVVAAALERVWAADWAEIRQCYQNDGDVRRQFRAHLEWFAISQRRLSRVYGAVMGTFDMALGVAVPEQVSDAMRGHAHTHAGRMRQSIAEALGPNAPPDQVDWASDIASQAVAGTMIRARLTNDLAPLEAIPDAVLRLVDLISRRSAPD